MVFIRSIIWLSSSPIPNSTFLSALQPIDNKNNLSLSKF